MRLFKPEVEATKGELESIFEWQVGVGIGVEVLPPGSPPRYKLKVRRFFDQRPAGHP